MQFKKCNIVGTTRGLICSIMILISPFSYASIIEKERETYLGAIDAIENGNLKQFQALKKNLTSYPLYPYLEYRSILPKLKDMPYKKVLAFETKYANLPFSDDVRRHYLYFLAKEKRWKELVQYQKKTPSSKVNQCNYYYAHTQVGNYSLALKGARKLYLSGNSITSACDKLFQFMEAKNKLTDELILERMLLVFERGNRSLLRYLSKQLSDKNKNVGSQVLAFYYEPEKILNLKKNHRKTTFQRQLYQHAFKRLARIEPRKVINNFDAIVNSLNYKNKQKQQMAEYIVSRIMATSEPELIKWRDKWLSASKDQGLLERRFRLALAANDWPDIARWINLMPAKERDTTKWRYWRARVLFNEGREQEAEALLQQILGERNFYSLAASMHLGQSIDIPIQRTEPAFDQLEPFKTMLARVSELEAIKKISESKSEWLNILRKANRDQKAILAAYALEQNWYAHSVQATISGKLWEHLEYRFPVAHRWFFEYFSRENDLPVTTLLALSRQESAFYTNAVSSVGARGLMQLMPATAKETSSKLGFRYLGADSLNDPSTNIRIGSGYLRILFDKFQQNRILAFAAYNAGPHRVTKWLERSQGNLDVIAFIEVIPFRETRGYVQNVLMFETYYRKLLGMPMEFLYKQELAYNY